MDKPLNTDKQSLDSFISKVDPSRENIGKIYRDLQLAGSSEHYVIAGDLTNELMKSLVDDLNDDIKSDPFNGQAFYITVHEKKDLLMPRAIDRKLINTHYRPWPEDDTVVFHVFPNSGVIKFCWCLPHHTEMDNMLINAHKFNSQMIEDIKAYKKFDLLHFGFVKDSEGKWAEYPRHCDRTIKTA